MAQGNGNALDDANEQALPAIQTMYRIKTAHHLDEIVREMSAVVAAYRL